MNNTYRYKICMVGEPGVGKTSLVNRMSRGIFDEKYLTTVGLRVEQANVVTPGGILVDLALWDLAGGMEHRPLLRSALFYTRGVFVVVDPSKPCSFSQAQKHAEWVQQIVPSALVCFIFNKTDIRDLWLPENSPNLCENNLSFLTSAKTGEGVHEVFSTLADKLLLTEGKGKQLEL